MNVQPDYDGKIRRIDSGARIAGENLMSMPLALTLYDAPDYDETFLVNYGLDLSEIDIISAIDVIERKVDPERLAEKKLF